MKKYRCIAEVPNGYEFKVFKVRAATEAKARKKVEKKMKKAKVIICRAVKKSERFTRL